MFRIAYPLSLIFALFLLINPAKAQSPYCQPGTACSFPLASQGSACRYNEDRFFSLHGNSWTFQPNEGHWLNNDLGDFGKNAGYQETYNRITKKNIYGGCVCETSSWIFYVAEINGFDAFPTAKYHSYPIVGIPAEFSISIDDNDGSNQAGTNPFDPTSNIKAGGAGDLWIKNTSTEVWAIRWQITGDNVAIWVEKNAKSVSELPIEVDSSSSNQPIVSVGSVDTSVSFSQLPTIPRLFSALFVGTATVFLIGFIFSKKFRSGAVTVLLVTTPLVLLLIYLLPR